MLPSGLLFTVLAVASARAAHMATALDCVDPTAKEAAACDRRTDDVVAMVPGASYVARLDCVDCPHAGRGTGTSDPILFLNLTLSRDKRAILLNDKPLHPLQTIPTPPAFSVTQFPSTFSNTNLSAGIACSNPYCRTTGSDCLDWCERLPLSAITLDYLYLFTPASSHGRERDPDAQHWEISLDAIGGQSGQENAPHWKFDEPSQKMLWMLVAGKVASTERYKGEKDMQAASDLFGPFGEEKSYEYNIVDMKLVERKYSFPSQKSRSLWASLRRFFGNDVWEVDGSRFVYLAEEWGTYGKMGTLRNTFGHFVRWEYWYLFWTILGGAVGGSLLLFGLYKLFLWVVEQRDLAKWDGMDDVWDRLRREPDADEEDTLLDSGYLDDPEEGQSSRPQRYTDEPQTMKPLPSKPLPEKPLPAVPLIDA